MSNGAFTEKDLPDIHKTLVEMFELNMWNDVANACYQVLERYPTAWQFWLLASQSHSFLSFHDQALEDVEFALRFAPDEDLTCIYQLHLIYIAKNRFDWIANSINQIFPNKPRAKQDELAAYAHKFLSSGAIGKNELSNEVLAHMIRLGLNE